MDNINLEELIEKAMQKYLEDKYIFIATSRNEYLQAVHASDILCAIWDVDNTLRNEIKWANDLSNDTVDAYDKIRQLIYDTMDKYGVSLDMLE